ncbi:MAG: isoleucine--tRNA ligase [bacterium]
MTNQVEHKVNQFAEMEKEVGDFWNRANIFQKSVEREAPRGDYVFYDGPPFATGLPHYGHIVGSVMKDVVPRYFTMNGYKVERKWGWDCHGLPIENIAEKELGFNQKKDIIEYGIDKFNELCRTRVEDYAENWEKVMGRLGRWADMKNSYRTMDLPYMESIWWVFKQLWDKDLIYEGYRSIHVCPRCETTLSQSEVSEGYKDVKDLSAIAKFKLTSESETYILAWTTTPWTLIGNVALAVGAEIEYVKVQLAEIKLILAKSRLEQIFKDKEYVIVEHIKGSQLVGMKYEPLFDFYAKNENLPNRENGWQIYAADFVTTEDGTGVVHIAPAFGEDDLNLGKEFNLPFVQHVGMDGLIKTEAGEKFAGLSVKPIDDHTKTDIEIIKHLAHAEQLFHKEKYEHSYPHCWRCDTPLINYVTSSWFIDVTKIKHQALVNASGINWTPAHIKDGRFGNWLGGARDWSISRQRFWASVMPIWVCQGKEESETDKTSGCSHKVVFGSVAELEAACQQKVSDLHKHIVDDLTFKCSECGGMMKRVPDVLDTWFDSGAMPYAQMHYPFENKEKFEANFPAAFIAEGIDQTRCWFYYMHILGTAVLDKPAYKNVVVNGTVLAEDGKKMSKRLNNYPDPVLMFDKYSADAMRNYLLTSSVMGAENLNFSEKGVEEAMRKNVMILWNVYKFYEMYAIEGSRDDRAENISTNKLDQWILAKLDSLIIEVTKNMEAYDLPRSARPIGEFVNELSTWYLRRSRDRFKSDDQVDKGLALQTTKHVLLQLSKVMAPFMPFMAEQLWQKVGGYNFSNFDQSVHLEAWPVRDIKNFESDKKNIDEMEVVRKIVEAGLAARDEKGIKIRQPLPYYSTEVVSELAVEYLEIIKDELNVLEVRFGESILGTEMTEELLQDGARREIVRFVNALRKNAGLTIEDRIVLHFESSDKRINDTIEIYKQALMKDVLANDIVVGKSEVLIEKKVVVNGAEVWLGLQKK